MRFGSVCSGIEAASVAWNPLGWEAAWFSEIEPFPCAVLTHRYQHVPNLGDMTALPERIRSGEVEAPDVFCGGTPCQAFSVAGKRQSLDDARGNLSLVFCEIANAIDDVRGVAGQQPTIVFWENVPGVLSTKDNAFGCFLGELAGEDCAIEPPRGKWTNAGCVYGPKRTVAWRVLDAQYFGVAQRRRRVFVVASARTDIDPAAILFEFDGLRRDTAPRRETGKEVAGTISSRTTGGGGLGTDFECAGGLQPVEKQAFEVANCLTARMHKGINTTIDERQTPVIAFDCKASGQNGFGVGEVASTMRSMIHTNSHANGGGHLAVAVSLRGREGGATAEIGDEVQNCLRASNGGGDKAHVLAPVYTTKLHNTQSNNAGKLFEERSPCLDANSPAPALLTPMAVRRLTPVECERLQGFPDNYTKIPWKAYQAYAKRKGVMHDGRSFEEWLIETTGHGLRQPTAQECPDGPRYKALGNSWAVPVVRWIGRRIQLAVEVAG